MEIAESFLGGVTPSGDLFIGSTLGTSNFFNGLIDEVAIYRRALSVDDVRRNCRLNDPTGSTCPDPKEPIILTPTPNQVLPPTRAYWSWRGERNPDGTLANPDLAYEVKFDMDGNGDGDFTDGSDLLNQVPVSDPMLDTASDSWYYVESRSPAIISNDRNYALRIRPIENGTTLTQFESTRLFSTDNSVVGWWSFEEGAGTLIGDIIGTNDGTLRNASVTGWSSGVLDNAFLFDGTDDYVLIGDVASLEGMAELTVEAWVNTTSTDANRAIVAKWYQNPSSYALRLDTGGTIQFSTQTAGAGVSVNSSSTSPVNDGGWHHLVGSYDGATQSLLIDNVLEDSDTQTGSIYNSDEQLCIADFCDLGVGQGGNFDGLIDEVILYNRGLSALEVCNSYLAFCRDPASAVPAASCDDSCVSD